MGKVNLKKLLLFGVVSSLAPLLTGYVESAQSGHAIPFTAGTILVPAAANLVVTLAALFSNPRRLR